MKILFHSIILLFLIPFAYSQETVTFCDLVRNPEKYSGKEVTIRATYRFGFEWSYLYCLGCADQGRAWLEFPSDYDDLDKTSQRALKRLPKDAGIADITVRGVFVGPGSYGHLGGYRYKFIIREVRNTVVLIKGMRAPDVEKNAEQKSACGGSNPK